MQWTKKNIFLFLFRVSGNFKPKNISSTLFYTWLWPLWQKTEQNFHSNLRFLLFVEHDAFFSLFHWRSINKRLKIWMKLEIRCSICDRMFSSDMRRKFRLGSSLTTNAISVTFKIWNILRLHYKLLNRSHRLLSRITNSLFNLLLMSFLSAHSSTRHACMQLYNISERHNVSIFNVFHFYLHLSLFNLFWALCMKTSKFTYQ